MAAAHTPEEKRADALAVYQAHGLAEAHRQSGVARSTLRDWARAAGLDTAALSSANAERLSAAHEAREQRIEEMRGELREELLAAALDCTERIRAPHVDYRGSSSVEVTFDHAPSGACRDYSIAAGTFLDKFRLESGESTDRTEHLSGDLDQRKRAVTRMRDELALKRESKSA